MIRLRCTHKNQSGVQCKKVYRRRSIDNPYCRVCHRIVTGGNLTMESREITRKGYRRCKSRRRAMTTKIVKAPVKGKRNQNTGMIE